MLAIMFPVSEREKYFGFSVLKRLGKKFNISHLLTLSLSSSRRVSHLGLFNQFSNSDGWNVRCERGKKE